jgi:hypothetical protein
LAVLFAIALVPPATGGTVDLEFQRFWPALQQPNYFRSIYDVQVNPDGSIYALERGVPSSTSTRGRVLHYTADGRFIRAIDTLPFNSLFTLQILKSLAVDEEHAFVASGGSITRYRLSDGEADANWAIPSNTGSGCGAGGLEFFPNGDLALACDVDQQVHIFTRDGDLLDSWPAEFLFYLDAMAITPAGEVLLIDAAFVGSADGARVRRYTRSGVATGIFLDIADPPASNLNVFRAIAVNAAGQIAIASEFDVQVYDSSATLLAEFSSEPTANTIFSGAVIDWFGESQVWIGDQSFELPKLGRFDVNTGEQLIIASGGTANGKFRGPVAVAAHPNGSVYVLDYNRVQQFSTEGVFVRAWNTNRFESNDLAVDPATGDIFTLTRGRVIDRFSETGDFLTVWSQFNDSSGSASSIAVGTDGAVFVAEQTEISRYNPPLDGLRTSPHTFDRSVSTFVSALAVAGDGRLYASIPLDDVVREINPTNLATLSQWDYCFGPCPPNVSNVYDIVPLTGNRLALFGPSDGVLNIADLDGNRIESLDLQGIGPGEIQSVNSGGSASADGLLFYVADTLSNRVQKYVFASSADSSRAIVVAAGGPFPGNSLWEATQANANFAYRSLTFQGFRKDTIHYLSSDLNLDLDQNGIPDDVDADAVNANLQEAILGPGGSGVDGFAGDPQLEELVLYLTNHGGEDRFRMSAAETLDAADLDGWLDTWQLAHPAARVVLVYDACQSGSFLDRLRGGNRTIITSAEGDENAYFISQGLLSFSNFFWTHVFNGLDLRNAFQLAEQSTVDIFSDQHPQVDVDGDGVANEPVEDLDALANVFLGNGTNVSSTRPQIGSVEAPIAPISEGSTATITARDVTDSDGIVRVWAALRPPGFNPGSLANPVTELPSFDLQPIGGNDYTFSYDGFVETGTYEVTVNAIDVEGNTAVPRIVSVSVSNPLRRRVVVIVGGEPSDAVFPASLTGAEFAIKALKQQGYGDGGTPCLNNTSDDICFLVDAGVADADGTPVLSNIQFALETWAVDEAMDGDADDDGLADETRDLTVFIIGERVAGGIRLAGGEVLTPLILDGYLSAVQSRIAGTLTLVVEANDASGFIQALTPSAGRITVASAGVGEVSRAFANGAISFSKFFWGATLNGASVRQAFRNSSQAVAFGSTGQGAALDDNGNGIPNELLDGLFSRQYTIGTGLLLAGDEPVIGSAEIPPLAARSMTLTASQVTSTSSIDRVYAAVVTEEGDAIETELVDQGGGRFVAVVSLPDRFGSLEVALYALDDQGGVSFPVTANVLDDALFRSGFESSSAKREVVKKP